MDAPPSSSPAKETTPLWQKFALILGGVFVPVVVVGLMLMLFPGLIPSPANRNEAGTMLDVSFSIMDGDLWLLQEGRIKPPEENTIYWQGVLAWDETGFRVPAMTAEKYPIAAFGDSYTEATTVQQPWTDVLAAELNTPVRNYGYRGYGPLEIAHVAEQFAGEDERSWVLYMHFSGNDLWNANTSLQDDLMQRNPFTLATWLADQARDNISLRTIEIPEAENYDYPMPVIIGGSYYELVFLEFLLWWQVMPQGDYLDTKTFRTIGSTLDTISASVNENACKAVIFAPSKEQIYYRYIHPQSRKYFNIAYQEPYVENNRIQLRAASLPEAEIEGFIARLDEQRDAMQTLASQHGWQFIDLLEAFETEATKERLLYYPYDTHWNQAGHDLAAQVIANYMQAQSATCPLTN